MYITQCKLTQERPDGYLDIFHFWIPSDKAFDGNSVEVKGEGFWTIAKAYRPNLTVEMVYGKKEMRE